MADTSASSALPIPAFQLACWFIKRGTESGADVTQMKLHKLIYFAQGWHCGIYGKPLMDEQIEAWRYGPVVPSLWRRFKYSGVLPLELSKEGKLAYQSIEEKLNQPENSEVKHFLETIWAKFKDYGGIALSRLTHQDGSPWLAVRNGDSYGHSSVVISPEKITSYFRNKAIEQHIIKA